MSFRWCPAAPIPPECLPSEPPIAVPSAARSPSAACSPSWPRSRSSARRVRPPSRPTPRLMPPSSATRPLPGNAIHQPARPGPGARRRSSHWRPILRARPRQGLGRRRHRPVARPRSPDHAGRRADGRGSPTSSRSGRCTTSSSRTRPSPGRSRCCRRSPASRRPSGSRAIPGWHAERDLQADPEDPLSNLTADPGTVPIFNTYFMHPVLGGCPTPGHPRLQPPLPPPRRRDGARRRPPAGRLPIGVDAIGSSSCVTKMGAMSGWEADLRYEISDAVPAPHRHLRRGRVLGLQQGRQHDADPQQDRHPQDPRLLHQRHARGRGRSTRLVGRPAIAKKTHGAHFIVDTADNGTGPLRGPTTGSTTATRTCATRPAAASGQLTPPSPASATPMPGCGRIRPATAVAVAADLPAECSGRRAPRAKPPEPTTSSVPGCPVFRTDRRARQRMGERARIPGPFSDLARGARRLDARARGLLSRVAGARRRASPALRRSPGPHTDAAAAPLPGRSAWAARRGRPPPAGQNRGRRASSAKRPSQRTAARS